MTDKPKKEFVDTLFEQAFLLHQNGESEQAEKLYISIVNKMPGRADVLHLLGILCGQQGRYEESLIWLRKALAVQPNSATFHNSVGNVYRHLGNVEQATHHYRYALKLHPNSPATNNNLGILYHKQNQLSEAEAYYRAAVTIKPDYADAYFNLSTVYTLQQKYEDAIANLRLALQYQPNHIQANTHLAQLLLQTGQTEEAVEYYQARLKIDPTHADSHHQLAVALTRQSNTEQAITHYLQTLALQPDHLEALHNLGVLYLQQRKPEMALQYYLRLLELQPNLDTYYNLGVIYLYQDRHEDAINYLKEALRLDSNFFNAHLNLGAVYLKKDDLVQASLHYEAALALQPDDPEILYILAAITQKEKKTSSPTIAPKAYVEHLFDEYAPYFDKHLTEMLNYQVPTLLFKALTEVVGVKQEKWRVLDLGCGTGLCGVTFRPLAQFLIGVDLSANMLTAAKEKQIYDELKQQDLIEVMKEYMQQIDLLIAGDVLGYVGDLEPVFYAAKACLQPKGWWVFTTEQSDQEPFYLQNNARFAHHKIYIEQLAQTIGFCIERSDNAILRSQKQQSVQGYVWVLRREEP